MERTKQVDDHGTEYIGQHSEAYEGPWQLTYHWAKVDGATRCIGVDVRSFREKRSEQGVVTSRRNLGGIKAEPITATLVRDIPIARKVREALEDVHAWARQARGSNIEVDPSVFEPPEEGRRRTWTTKELAAVAEVYREAHRAGRPPRRAVAEAVGVSLAMASKLIRAARDHGGLLGETTQGKAGGTEEVDR